MLSRACLRTEIQSSHVAVMICFTVCLQKQFDTTVKTWTLADPLFIVDGDLERTVKYPQILLLVFILAFLKHAVNEKFDLYADVREKNACKQRVEGFTT